MKYYKSHPTLKRRKISVIESNINSNTNVHVVEEIARNIPEVRTTNECQENSKFLHNLLKRTVFLIYRFFNATIIY